MTSPRAWRRYTLASKTSSVGIDPRLSRFAARYRVAASFVGLDLEGYSQATSDAYGSAMRVALAYSAHEALDDSLERPVGRTAIESPTLSAAFRQDAQARLRQMLMSSLTSEKLVVRLERLVESPTDTNVMPIAQGVRHLVFHGDFTAHGSGGAQSASTRRFLDSLAEEILAGTDRDFEVYLDRLGIGPWSVVLRKTCQSCGVSHGVRHEADCEIAVCSSHGERLSECSSRGRHTPNRYWGVYPGTMEALSRGWTFRRQGRDEPDINRVITSLKWNPRTERYED